MEFARLEGWNRIIQILINNLISSLKNRYANVLPVWWGNITYKKFPFLLLMHMGVHCWPPSRGRGGVNFVQLLSDNWPQRAMKEAVWFAPTSHLNLRISLGGDSRRTRAQIPNNRSEWFGIWAPPPPTFLLKTGLSGQQN